MSYAMMKKTETPETVYSIVIALSVDALSDIKAF